MQDEFSRRMAENVYDYIEKNFQDIEIVSLKSCISISKKGYIKFATITPMEKKALLLHYPQEIRDNLLTRKDEFDNKYDKPKRESYVNQINIPLVYIHNVNNLFKLIKIAYDNPRRIRKIKESLL